ncbi:winged helix-turn-helix transcriptional regulator [Microbacteriaceae bacterium VKM Ac-2855]|nr:winged helix-turn-helix transcriptional regulator [Microbacteriaceae bacterium VKM Ac-2855]
MSVPQLLTSTVFRLGVLGARWEDAFARSIATEGIRPKHVAVLALLREGVPRTQQDLAVMMGVGPSLVVALATDLETSGAIVRERDSSDRRRQQLRLTPAGESLLERCEMAMSRLDAVVADALGRRATDLDAALAALEGVQRPG